MQEAVISKVLKGIFTNVGCVGGGQNSYEDTDEPYNENKYPGSEIKTDHNQTLVERHNALIKNVKNTRRAKRSLGAEDSGDDVDNSAQEQTTGEENQTEDAEGIKDETTAEVDNN